ncbi:MAG: hypothetical protein K2Q12_00190 [Rickettsiales bacterium]|nr:hypothetical protein [Rickettsiales bacterium]
MSIWTFGLGAVGKAAQGVGRTVGSIASAAPKAAAGVAAVTLAPLAVAGNSALWVAALPVRLASSALRVPGVKHVAALGALATGGVMAYNALSGRSKAKTLPPELEQLQASAANANAQQAMIAQAQQQQQAMAEAMAAPQAPVLPTSASNDNPNTRLQVANGAQLQGLAKAGSAEMSVA